MFFSVYVLKAFYSYSSGSALKRSCKGSGVFLAPSRCVDVTCSSGGSLNGGNILRVIGNFGLARASHSALKRAPGVAGGCGLAFGFGNGGSGLVSIPVCRMGLGNGDGRNCTLISNSRHIPTMVTCMSGNAVGSAVMGGNTTLVVERTGGTLLRGIGRVRDVGSSLEDTALSGVRPENRCLYGITSRAPSRGRVVGTVIGCGNFVVPGKVLG